MISNMLYRRSAETDGQLVASPNHNGIRVDATSGLASSFFMSMQGAVEGLI